MADINQTELNELLDCKSKLRALENAGVDNWEGYDLALGEYRANKEKIDKADAVLEEIMEVLSVGIYEPSERGAGFAFADEAMERAQTIIRKLVV